MKEEGQKAMVHGKIPSIVTHLDAIGEELCSLIKEMEMAMLPVSVEDYFKFLLASERIREAIEILERIPKETESVTSTT